MSARSRKVQESDVDQYNPESGVIPWPEWLDVDVNNEKWAAPKNGPDGLFLDTQPVAMPPSIQVNQWIRARNLKNLGGQLTVNTADSDYPDLITNNRHILHSEFVRWYISSLINIQYCGRDGLEISGDSPNFVWNYRRQRWRGWLHVYSMNKCGKDAVHKPVINPNGKYVVRLHFMGCWRRVVVDDMIPVDQVGKPLLPRTAFNFELWPMLLAKALLKLASLTWTHRSELVDFYPIGSLTGWVCLRINIADFSVQEKWDFLIKYAEHFEWPTSVENKEPEEPLLETVKHEGKTTRDSAKKKKKKESAHKIEILEKPQPTMLFISLEDLREATPDLVPGLTPCWNHFIHVIQFRDVPLDPKDMKPPLARWKLYRWICWAIKHNLIDPADYFIPIRCLKVVSALKECRDSIAYAWNDIDEQEVGKKKVVPLEKGSMTAKDIESPKSGKKSPKPKDEPLADISFWADFNKMHPYIREAYLFYKLEYFVHTMRMCDTGPVKVKVEQTNQRSSSKESRKESKKSTTSKAETVKETSEFELFHAWPQNMKMSRNEPLYFFCDSLQSKSFLINFSTMAIGGCEPLVKDEATTENLPGFRSGKKNYLIIEEHNWFRKPSTPLISIYTAGTNSAVYELGPGRHLWRLYCSAEVNCCTTISSDDIFHVGDRQKMHKLMLVESETINMVSKNINVSLINAFNSFGHDSYPEALKSFYRSYMPKLQSAAKSKQMRFLKEIHNYFMEELLMLIKKYILGDEFDQVLRCLKVFFINPNIGRDKLVAISLILKNLEEMNTSTQKLGISRDDLDSGEDNSFFYYNNAAMVIQSFFKMVLVKRYKQFHDPSHAQHKKIQESLQSIVGLFKDSEPELLSSLLLRGLIQRHDKLKVLYPCSRDFPHVLQIQECKGLLIHIKPDQWLPIVRLIVNPNESEIVIAAIYLFINLVHYTLRVFDNENGREMFRLINNVAPVTYKHVKTGYTIFGYGWSENLRLKELEWKMHIVTVKGEPKFHLLDSTVLSDKTHIPNLMIEELSNTYIPNAYNIIAKWILRITTTSVLSLRLKVSYDLAQTRLRITNGRGHILSEVEGGSVVILPLVYLEFEEEQRLTQRSTIKKKSIEAKTADVERNEENEYTYMGERKSELRNTYFLEASVLNDSWPLTETEWAIVAEAKGKELRDVVKTRISSLSRHKLSRVEIQKLKKASKHSMDSLQTWQSPYWILQAVTDSGNVVEIQLDRTREKEIAALKESWWKDDPGRLQHCKKLRETFLDDHALVITESLLAEPRISMTSQGYPVVKSNQDIVSVGSWFPLVKPVEVRTLKPPKSYRNYLPSLDLSIYIKKDDEEEESWVKRECDEEVLRNRRLVNIIDAEEAHESFVQEKIEILENQKSKYKKLLGSYLENFRNRRARMEEAYELRRFCLESVKSEKSSVKDLTIKKPKKKKKKQSATTGKN